MRHAAAKVEFEKLELKKLEMEKLRERKLSLKRMRERYQKAKTPMQKWNDLRKLRKSRTCKSSGTHCVKSTIVNLFGFQTKHKVKGSNLNTSDDNSASVTEELDILHLMTNEEEDDEDNGYDSEVNSEEYDESEVDSEESEESDELCDDDSYRTPVEKKSYENYYGISIDDDDEYDRNHQRRSRWRRRLTYIESMVSC